MLCYSSSKGGNVPTVQMFLRLMFQNTFSSFHLEDLKLSSLLLLQPSPAGVEWRAGLHVVLWTPANWSFSTLAGKGIHFIPSQLGRPGRLQVTLGTSAVSLEAQITRHYFKEPWFRSNTKLTKILSELNPMAVLTVSFFLFRCHFWDLLYGLLNGTCVVQAVILAYRVVGRGWA